MQLPLVAFSFPRGCAQGAATQIVFLPLRIYFPKARCHCQQQSNRKPRNYTARQERKNNKRASVLWAIYEHCPNKILRHYWSNFADRLAAVRAWNPSIRASRNTRRSSPCIIITDLLSSTLGDYFCERSSACGGISFEPPRGKQVSQEIVEGTDFCCEFTKNQAQRPVLVQFRQPFGLPTAYFCWELPRWRSVLREPRANVLYFPSDGIRMDGPAHQSICGLFCGSSRGSDPPGSRSISRVRGSTSLNAARRKGKKEEKRVKRMCCSHDAFHTLGNWIQGQTPMDGARWFFRKGSACKILDSKRSGTRRKLESVEYWGWSVTFFGGSKLQENWYLKGPKSSEWSGAELLPQTLSLFSLMENWIPCDSRHYCHLYTWPCLSEIRRT